jgi:hypothetical protein
MCALCQVQITFFDSNAVAFQKRCVACMEQVDPKGRLRVLGPLCVELNVYKTIKY